MPDASLPRLHPAAARFAAAVLALARHAHRLECDSDADVVDEASERLERVAMFLGIEGEG